MYLSAYYVLKCILYAHVYTYILLFDLLCYLICILCSYVCIYVDILLCIYVHVEEKNRKEPVLCLWGFQVDMSMGTQCQVRQFFQSKFMKTPSLSSHL